MRRLFFSLLPIQVLAVGLPAISTLLNGFIVGHYLGPVALAAIGFAGPLDRLFSIISGMLANGSQLKSGHDLGRGDRESLSRTFNTTWITAAVVSAALACAIFLFTSGIAKLLGASNELLRSVCDYLRGIAPSVFFNVLFACMLSFLQLDRAEKHSTAAVIVMLVIQTGFNFLNIYVLHWGLFGTGLATSLANLAALLVCLPYFFGKNSSFRFNLRSFRFDTIRKIAHLGLPSAIPYICSFFRDRLFNTFVFAIGGTTGMAAMTIASNINSSIGCGIEGGYSASTSLLSSVLVGERDVDTLRDLPGILIRAMLPILAGTYAAIFVAARPIALFFGAEPEHIGIYVSAIRFLNLWLLTNAFKTPTLSIYRSLDMVGFVTAMHVVNIIVCPVICCLLSRRFGLNMIFHSSWIGETLLVLIYIVYYSVKRKKLSRSIDSITYVPNSISVPAANRFSATIRGASDATRASEDTIAFCISKNLPVTTSNMCGLCIEEMAIDSIVHGFTRGKKGAYSIDLRVVYENGEIAVMLRDNCPHFNPQEWLAMYADSDLDRSMGLKLAADCAKEMTYSSALGMNIINIRL